MDNIIIFKSPTKRLTNRSPRFRLKTRVLSRPQSINKQRESKTDPRLTIKNLKTSWNVIDPEIVNEHTERFNMISMKNLPLKSSPIKLLYDKPKDYKFSSKFSHKESLDSKHKSLIKAQLVRRQELYRSHTETTIQKNKRKLKDPYDLSKKLIKASKCRLIPKNDYNLMMIQSPSIKHRLKICKDLSRSPRPASSDKPTHDKSFHTNEYQVYIPTTDRNIPSKSKKSHKIRSSSIDITGWNVVN